MARQSEEEKLTSFEKYFRGHFFSEEKKKRFFDKGDGKDSLSSIETYLFTFLGGITNEDEKEKLITRIIEAVHKYDYEMEAKETFEGEPNKLIKSDINTILKYQKMVKRLYEVKWLQDSVQYDTVSSILSVIPKEIRETYENNKKLLLDLQSKQFKIIKIDRYSNSQLDKTEIREIIEAIQKKYNLKVSDAKKLIDNI